MFDKPEGKCESAGIFEFLGFSSYLFYSFFHLRLHFFVRYNSDFITSSWFPPEDFREKFPNSILRFIIYSFSVYPRKDVSKGESVSVVELFKVDDRIDVRDSEFSRKFYSQRFHVSEEGFSSVSSGSCFFLGSYMFFEIIEIFDSVICLESRSTQ